MAIEEATLNYPVETPGVISHPNVGFYSEEISKPEKPLVDLARISVGERAGTEVVRVAALSKLFGRTVGFGELARGALVGKATLERTVSFGELARVGPLRRPSFEFTRFGVFNVPLEKGHTGDIELRKLKEFYTFRERFIKTGGLEPEEMATFFELKKYAEKNRKKDWLKELEKIQNVENHRHMIDILNITSKFGRTGTIKPEEMLKLIESKNYVLKIRKGSLLADLETIQEIQNWYYRDTPSIPTGLEKLLEKEPITLKDAKKSLAKVCEMVKNRELDNRQIAVHLRMLEKRLISTSGRPEVLFSHHKSHLLL